MSPWVWDSLWPQLGIRVMCESWGGARIHFYMQSLSFRWPAEGPAHVLWRETVLTHNCCLQGENKKETKTGGQMFNCYSSSWNLQKQCGATCFLQGTKSIFSETWAHDNVWGRWAEDIHRAGFSWYWVPDCSWSTCHDTSSTLLSRSSQRPVTDSMKRYTVFWTS